MKGRRLEQRGAALEIIAAVTLLATLIGAMTMAKAEPLGPTTLSVVESSRRTNFPVATIEAQAGNVTELLINATTVTKAWAGYYGNVTGTITLDDARNNTLYKWDIDRVVGEIYAARSPADFSSASIRCANSTNVQSEETALNIGPADRDGVNETFTYTTHPAFYVGSKFFAQDECNYTVSTYVNDQQDSARTFNETLLYDATNDQIVYMAILANNQDGFKIGSGDIYDFQMLVGEDGHGNTATTTYYFYVELE